jgi:hypothetical protein
MIKLCKDCGISKDSSEFSHHSGICKPCRNEKYRKYYQKNKEHVADVQRKYRHENKEIIYARWKSYYQKNRERIMLYWKEFRKENGKKIYEQEKAIRMTPSGKKRFIANHKVYEAILSGKMSRPTVCENCHSVSRTEGHHVDYDKPLDVIWLCRSCHENVHRKVRKVS